MKILIVDDDLGDRKLVEMLVRQIHADADIEGFESARQAQAADLKHVDVIFLDRECRTEMASACLNRWRKKWLRAAIFLMTGQADDLVAKSAILLGATDYIPKRSISRNAIERLLKTGRDAAEMRWKLEQQRQELLTFAHVLVHDFRAPIVQANSITELLDESINDGDQDAIQTELALLRKSTGQMSELIDSLSSHIRNDRAAEMEVGP